MTPLDTTALDRAGLNLQAVFNLDALPADMAAMLRERFDPARRYRQLILIGHGGKTLWDAVQASGIASDNPIDDFSAATVTQCLAAQFPGLEQQVIYPSDAPIGLQALGTLAGWHHPSPLRIGINERWGTWYAYRVVVLADSDLEPSRPEQRPSPCVNCQSQACIAACPADALQDGEFSLPKCIAYRRQADSLCRTTCLARVSCPVGSEHRYSDAQLFHTYSRSLQAIAQYC